jgi:hypothetical protein
LTTEDLGISIADTFSPAEGDSLIIMLWDGATQTPETTSGNYYEGAWLWDNPQDISTGMPCVIFLYHPPGITITWP